MIQRLVMSENMIEIEGPTENMSMYYYCTKDDDERKRNTCALTGIACGNPRDCRTCSFPIVAALDNQRRK